MKKVIVGLLLMSSSFASANVVSVEFIGCAKNSQTVCALVYSDLTTGANYQGQEMVVEASNPADESKIAALTSQFGRSLAMNIDGTVFQVNGFGGRSYKKLRVNSLTVDANAPRPRGF